MNVKTLGMQIRFLRKKAGYTQEALAEAADLSPTYLSQIECGKKKVSLNALIRLSEALGVTVDCLLSGNQGLAPSEVPPEIQRLFSSLSDQERHLLLETLTAFKHAFQDYHIDP